MGIKNIFLWKITVNVQPLQSCSFKNDIWNKTNIWKKNYTGFTLIVNKQNIVLNNILDVTVCYCNKYTTLDGVFSTEYFYKYKYFK